jgi:ABC-type transporter Mla subunit MlaD
MNRAGVATAATLGAAVLAGAGATATAAVPVVAVAREPARPAESGASDSAATLGPLAIGAEVTDRAGAKIGHVTRLTTDKQGRAVAEVRNNEDVYSIPLEDLFPRGRAAFSSLSLGELKHNGMAH